MNKKGQVGYWIWKRDKQYLIAYLDKGQAEITIGYHKKLGNEIRMFENGDFLVIPFHNAKK
jgi:hypothetical protein